MFTSILAATDRVTGRDPVVISAARMASALGASWSIVHVLASASPDNHERVLHFGTGQTVDATARYRSEIRRQLRHAYSDLFAWSTPCEIRIATGIPWKEIDRQASLLAGIPQEIPAWTLNIVCGSGMKPVHIAAQQIKAGDARPLAGPLPPIGHLKGFPVAKRK